MLSIEYIKSLGLKKDEETIDLLINMFNDSIDNIDIKREIISSIGRQANNVKIYNFINTNAFSCGFMEYVYQMYRTCLYKSSIKEFKELGEKILSYYKNEMLYKMKEYYDYRQNYHKESKVEKINKPLLLKGNNIETLTKVKDNQIQLIFTSPPYYNARVYSDYKSYQDYLDKMKETLKQCFRVLEDGRFIIINVSPVITKRPGREFESIRYPIHYDFHKILTDVGFYFVDEILWIKPETSVKNRNGGYQQTRMPLSYKPNCITESLMVYRKKAPFLLDKNIHKYSKQLANKKPCEDTSNCWYIQPKADKNHPAVFPEELCEKVLTYYSYIGDTVLDPFAGSGTFGRVAFNMNRIPVLCEMNEKYCDLIKRDFYYEI